MHQGVAPARILLMQINASGAGLLLGAALCIVLPEGFLTFAEAQV